MRARRIVVVLAALLALTAGTGTASARPASFSATSACVLLLSESTRQDRQVSSRPVETSADFPLVRYAPSRQRSAAWAEASVRFQRPPPVGY